jgi:hypothetical protein
MVWKIEVGNSDETPNSWMFSEFVGEETHDLRCGTYATRSMFSDPSTVMCGMEAILAEVGLGFVSF